MKLDYETKLVWERPPCWIFQVSLSSKIWCQDHLQLVNSGPSCLRVHQRWTKSYTWSLSVTFVLESDLFSLNTSALIPSYWFLLLFVMQHHSPWDFTCVQDYAATLTKTWHKLYSYKVFMTGGFMVWVEPMADDYNSSKGDCKSSAKAQVDFCFILMAFLCQPPTEK